MLCDQSYKINLSQSGFFVGYLLGSAILGFLGDFCGRRKVIVGSVLGLMLVQVLVALSPNFYFFAVGRFVVGLLVPGTIATFILYSEITGPSQRSYLTVFAAAMFGFAYAPLALVAYLLPNWRWVTASTVILNAIVFLLYKLA